MTYWDVSSGRALAVAVALTVTACRSTSPDPEPTAQLDRERLLEHTLQEAADLLAPGAEFRAIWNLLDDDGEISGIGIDSNMIPVQASLGDDLDREIARRAKARAIVSAGYGPPAAFIYGEPILVVLYEHRDGDSEELRYPILSDGNTVRFGPPEVRPRRSTVFAALDDE